MSVVEVSPEKCPLCGADNSCGNLPSNRSGACWCTDSAISFPEELLNSIPEELRGKACICKACALKYQKENN